MVDLALRPGTGIASGRRRLRAGAGWLGPAFVTAIAYVDPGNVATNFTAGSQRGYLLLWVVVAANAMAALVQFLSAKLGAVTGRSLPELLAERLSPAQRIAFWLQAELVSVATDVAEVIGGAVALQLLFQLPLAMGGLVTGAVSLLLPAITSRYGQRCFERVVTGVLAVIAGGFVAGLLVSRPAPGALAGGLVPRLAGSGSALLAAGMLGATLMPHAVYLHSALARDRFAPVRPADRRRVLRVLRADVGAAMAVAGTVNVAMLVLAASALRGRQLSGSLSAVPAALGDRLGPLFALLFAIGLLASGVASTAVGCVAGDVVMGGLLRRRVPPATRRLVTLVPALLVLAIGVDPTRALVLSQVVLSFGIPFALVPLAWLTSRAELMGDAVNGRRTNLAVGLVSVLVIALNVLLIWLTLAG